MKLVWAEVSHYKRFEKLSRMNLDSKVIAIVGPNEAGKSSFLNALSHWNHSEALQQEGSSQEISRGTTTSDSDIAFKCNFLLTEADKAALAEIPEASITKWFLVQKEVQGGEFPCELSPRPHRNLLPRRDSREKVERIVATLSSSQEQYEELISTLKSLQDTLVFDGEDFNEHNISKIQKDFTELESALAEFQETRGLEEGQGMDSSTSEDIILELDSVLSTKESLLETEQAEHPNTAAQRILFERRPKFLLFQEAERSLLSEYSLSLEDSSENIPIALSNLLCLAELPISELFTSFRSNDKGKIATIRGRANKVLASKFSVTWSQSRISVELDIQRITETEISISVLVGNLDTELENIAERSDGLRQFVALYAFIHTDITERPKILLVDEAELHLHYDAQADLVQMFAKQNLVDQVIYTTHSIGCLPEDLGTGIRLIEPSSDNRSTVKNWFWENTRPGFSPLLFSMGASSLAFLTVRHAVIVEGVVDHLLLPSLLKEVTGRSHLGFQVIPGLSNTSVKGLSKLDSDAGRIVYLTDSDNAKTALFNKLKDAGVSPHRIVSLPQRENEVSTIEDFLDPLLYVEAINIELARYHDEEYRISKADLDTFNVSKSIDAWCQSRKISAPSKRVVAYRVLELRHSQQFVNAERSELLTELYTQITAIFDKEK